MRTFLLSAVLALVMSFAVVNEAKAVAPVVAAPAVVYVTQGSIAGIVGVGMVGAPILVALVANQVDPWHALACDLFGDEGRVGNDTDSACNHLK